MKNIIYELEKIKIETQDINHNFIYDFIASNKGEINKNDFLERALGEISDNYEWDERKTLLIEFDLKELQIIEKSIDKVKKELDEIDYTTRIGATGKEINDLLQKVSNIVKGME